MYAAYRAIPLKHIHAGFAFRSEKYDLARGAPEVDAKRTGTLIPISRVVDQGSQSDGAKFDLREVSMSTEHVVRSARRKHS